MIKEIINMLTQNLELNGLMQMFIIILSSSVIGSVICITFKYSFSKSIYSKGLCISLMMFTVLSSILTSMFLSNTTLAVGALGALSIIRYRNVLKDPRDMIFILWSLISGICCGVSEFMLAGIGSFVIFAIIAMMNELYNTERFLISVIGRGNVENEIIEVFNKYLRGRAKVKVNNSNEKTTELIFQIPELSINERNSVTKSIKEKLYEIDEIQTVNVFCESEDMGI